MAQSAINSRVIYPADTWTLASETNFTFVVESGDIEVLGTQDAAPASTDTGVSYSKGQGEEADTDQLGRFVGAGTANRLYIRANGSDAVVFVSRPVVA